MQNHPKDYHRSSDSRSAPHQLPVTLLRSSPAPAGHTRPPTPVGSPPRSPPASPPLRAVYGGAPDNSHPQPNASPTAPAPAPAPAPQDIEFNRELLAKLKRYEDSIMSIKDATIEYRRSPALLNAYRKGLEMEHTLKRIREQDEEDKVEKRARIDDFFRRKAILEERETLAARSSTQSSSLSSGPSVSRSNAQADANLFAPPPPPRDDPPHRSSERGSSSVPPRTPDRMPPSSVSRA